MDEINGMTMPEVDYEFSRSRLMVWFYNHRCDLRYKWAHQRPHIEMEYGA